MQQRRRVDQQAPVVRHESAAIAAIGAITPVAALTARANLGHAYAGYAEEKTPAQAVMRVNQTAAVSWPLMRRARSV